MHAESSLWEWKTFSSVFHVTSLCGSVSLMWGGSEGGLFAFDPMSESFAIWTNISGLAFNQVTAVTCDEKGRIWIGMANGMLQRYDPEKSQWLSEDEYFRDRRMITCLTVKGDSLFVGLDVGLSLYLITKEEVKETYRRLGFQSDAMEYLANISAQAILVFQGTLWVATEAGMAHCRMDSTNLLDPGKWNTVTQANGLPDNNVTSMTALNSRIYAGTAKGISEFDGGQWTLLKNSHVFDMTVLDSRLYLAAEDGVFYRDGESWIPLGDSQYPIRYLSSVFSTLYGGTERGICVYSEVHSTWNSFVPNTLGSNVISDIVVDRDGYLWCCSRDRGFFRYDGTRWTIYDRTTLSGLLSNDVVSVAVDENNNKWFGTWGKGIILVGQDSSFQFYHAENGYLAGIPNDPTYAVVTDMVVDPSGTLWLLNYYALTNQPLLSVTPDGIWTRYGIHEGITTTFLTVIAVDAQGKKWIGSSDKGLFILHDNGSPAEKSDDPPIGRLTTSHGLESNQITALAVDRDGMVWIGTPRGLYTYFNESLYRRYGLPSDNITALEIDGVNNVWVGTNVGAAYFSNTSYSWISYTADNSGLVSNDVSALRMDYASGNMYIGTHSGLSRLATPFSEPVSQMMELSVYPNPFIPQRHGFLTIDQLTWNVSVLIFSSSGFLVRRFDEDEINGRQVLWDGTNQKGEPVAGGIYLVVAQDNAGKSRLGKIALVR